VVGLWSPPAYVKNTCNTHVFATRERHIEFNIHLGLASGSPIPFRVCIIILLHEAHLLISSIGFCFYAHVFQPHDSPFELSHLLGPSPILPSLRVTNIREGEAQFLSLHHASLPCFKVSQTLLGFSSTPSWCHPFVKGFVPSTIR